MRKPRQNGRIAIISTDVMGPMRNGGVGTSCTHLSIFLAAEGYEVDLIHADYEPVKKRWADFFATKNVNLKSFSRRTFELQCGGAWPALSYLAYDFLRNNHYDLVIFPDMGGLGYYSQMAKKIGLAFQDTNFLIMFLGPLTWSMEDNEDSFQSAFDLSIPMLERFSVENADVLQIATPWSQEWCEMRGWRIPSVSTVLFPFELPPADRGFRVQGEFDEIVFFGRLEPRKGLPEFLEAVRTLQENDRLHGTTITLLGSLGSSEGVDVEALIEEFRENYGIKLKLLTNKGSGEAIEYLKSGHRLAVLASRSETMGYTLIECLAHQIPFVASSISPFRTILGAQHEDLLFAPNEPRSLARTLAMAKENGRGIIDRTRAEALHRSTTERWRSLIRSRVAMPRKNDDLSPQEKRIRSSISVLVAHHNRAAYLDEALESLLRQSVRPFEVLVYDDASKNRDFLKTIEKWMPLFAEKETPLRLIEGQVNRGPGAARNELAKIARGDFFLFMDDDNRAHENEIETLDRIQITTNADVVSMAMTKFVDGQEHLWFERRWTPVGFDLNCAFFDNALGDTNFLIRATLFQTLGGFVDDPILTAEDMNILVKAALHGSKMFVCPEPLFSYRVHASNRSRVRPRHERRFHVEFMLNQLAAKAGIPSLSPLAQLLVSWNRKVGHEWVEEDSFSPKKIEKTVMKKTRLSHRLRELGGPSFRAFGCGWEVKLDRHHRIQISLPTLSRALGGFIDLNFVAEREGTLNCSNPAVRMKFSAGVNDIRFPVPDFSRDGFWVSFSPLKRVFITTFDVWTAKDASPQPIGARH